MARRPARIEVFGLVRPGDIHEMPWEDAPAFVAKLREADRDFFEVLDRGEPPLNEVMEFDHVVEVHADGSVTDAPPGVYAPTLYDDELDDSSWTMMKGYSGQDRYDGPIMHNSEYIGGGMERDILAEPGYYVALVSSYSEDADGEDDEEGNVEGWAVAYKAVPRTPGTGSGAGKYTKGAPIITIDDAEVGDLVYCDHGGEPPTINLARILRPEPHEPTIDGWLCVFVDPNNPDEKRMPSDHEWMLILSLEGIAGRQTYYKAVLA